MARSVLDGLTGVAANLVQLGRREVFLPSFEGGNGGQRSAERLGDVVRRRNAIRHGAVLQARAYSQRVRWIMSARPKFHTGTAPLAWAARRKVSPLAWLIASASTA